MRRFALQASFITVPVWVRACVRQELFKIRKLRTPLIKKKTVKSSPVFEISSWIWYTHHPSLTPPPQTQMTSQFCTTAHGCQRGELLHPSHWNAERSVWCTKWLVRELFESTDSTYSTDCEWWNWGTRTGRRSRPILRYHGISQQEIRKAQNSFEAQDSKTGPLH
jgi:hypothetical protein